MCCKNFFNWIDKANNPTKDDNYGFCQLISGSLNWHEAEKKDDKIKAIATCDKEAIYGELQTKEDFGCILFKPAT